MAILATAADGPPFTPVVADDPDRVQAVFGPPERSDLSAAYSQIALRVPPGSCVLVRLGGVRASASGQVDDGVWIGATSAGAGSHYNGLRLHFESEALRWTWPDGREGSVPTDAYPHLGALIAALQVWADLAQVPVRLYANRTELPVSALEGRELVLEGGSDSGWLDPDELFSALEEAYRALEDWPVDFVVPLRAYFDTPHLLRPYGAVYYDDARYDEPVYGPEAQPLSMVDRVSGEPMTFHQQWLRFARSQAERGILTHGLFNLRPVDPGEDDSRWVASLGQGTYLADRFGFDSTSPNDGGLFFSILAQHVETPYGWMPLSLYYCAAALTRVEAPMTGASLGLEDGVLPLLSEGALSDLGRLGMVGAGFRFRRGFVVAHAVTAAEPKSPWRAFDHVRALQRLTRALYTWGDPLIGERPPSPARRRAVERHVQKLLDDMVRQGVFREAKATLSGEAPLFLDVQLLPHGRTEWVTHRVRLS